MFKNHILYKNIFYLDTPLLELLMTTHGLDKTLEKYDDLSMSTILYILNKLFQFLSCWYFQKKICFLINILILLCNASFPIKL